MVMLEEIIEDLGDNYNDADDDILESIIGKVTTIAQSLSNNNSEELNPYIKECVKAMYLTRGGEGLQSLNESGKNSSFQDSIEKMRNDIIKAGLRRCF